MIGMVCSTHTVIGVTIIGWIGWCVVVHEYISLALGLGPGWLVAGSIVVLLVLVGVERIR